MAGTRQIGENTSTANINLIIHLQGKNIDPIWPDVDNHQ